MSKRVTLFVFDHSNQSEEEVMYALDLTDEELAEAALAYKGDFTEPPSITPQLVAWAALHYYDILDCEVTEQSIQ